MGDRYGLGVLQGDVIDMCRNMIPIMFEDLEPLLGGSLAMSCAQPTLHRAIISTDDVFRQ